MRWWPFRRSAEDEPWIDCQDMVELVNDYLEGALDPPTVKLFEEHLGECDACSAYIEQMRETIRLSGRVVITEDSLDPKLRDELLAAFRGWKQARGT